jgi:hypothetical protein
VLFDNVGRAFLSAKKGDLLSWRWKVDESSDEELSTEDTNSDVTECWMGIVQNVSKWNGTGALSVHLCQVLWSDRSENISEPLRNKVRLYEIPVLAASPIPRLSCCRSTVPWLKNVASSMSATAQKTTACWRTALGAKAQPIVVAVQNGRLIDIMSEHLMPSAATTESLPNLYRTFTVKSPLITKIEAIEEILAYGDPRPPSNIAIKNADGMVSDPLEEKQCHSKTATHTPGRQHIYAACRG